MKINLSLFLFLFILSNFPYPLIAQYNYINDSGALNMNLSEQGDCRILFLFSGVEQNVQIGYSPWQNIAIKGEYFFERKRQYDGRFKTDVFSLAVGTYHLMSKKRRRRRRGRYRAGLGKNSLLYLNAGMPRGLINHEWEQTESRLVYNKYFGDLGVKINYHIISFNLNLKYSNIQYERFKIIGKLNDHLRDTLDSFAKGSSFNALEINVMMEIGMRPCKVMIGFPSDLQTISIVHNANRKLYLGVVVDLDDIRRVLKG